MYIIKKCILFECYTMDNGFTYTFNNKISNLRNGNICIPIIKYNDSSFLKLAFTKLNITDIEKEKHLSNINNYNLEQSKYYFKSYENYNINYKEIDLYIFPTKEDYIKFNQYLDYYCILEDYEYCNFKDLKLTNLVLNYEYFGEIKYNINLLSKIKIDLNSNLVKFFSDKGLLDEIYIDVSSEKDLKDHIDYIKYNLVSIGFDKYIINKSIKGGIIDLNKIKSETMFENLKPYIN